MIGHGQQRGYMTYVVALNVDHALEVFQGKHENMVFDYEYDAIQRMRQENDFHRIMGDNEEYDVYSVELNFRFVA